MCSRKLYTLVFVRKPSEILLGWKKRGFGNNKWNGFGGKLENNETLLQAAERIYLNEECGLIATELKNIGLLEFEFENCPTIMEVHVFETYKYIGEIKESDEMLPQWFNIYKIPYQNMWPDDKYWFPYMLNQTPFKGYFLYNQSEIILKYTLDKIHSKELPYG